MGAIKEKDFKFGLKTIYWTIGEFEIKFAAKTAIVAMFGYTSEEAYRNGEAMTEQKTIQIEGDEFLLKKDCDIMATLWKMVTLQKIEKEKIGEEILDVEKNWFADSEPVLEVGQKIL